MWVQRQDVDPVPFSQAKFRPSWREHSLRGDQTGLLKYLLGPTEYNLLCELTTEDLETKRDEPHTLDPAQLVANMKLRQSPGPKWYLVREVAASRAI